jgi:hypothetical protein
MGRWGYFFISDKNGIVMLNEWRRMDFQEMCGTDHYKEEEENLHVREQYHINI